jgi:hypothetical protein
MKKQSRKGQFFAYDAIVAGTIFIILITILLVYWSSLRSLVFTQVDDMFRVGVAVSETLLTPGNPTDWPIMGAQQLGLTDRFGSVQLNLIKVDSIKTIPYSDLRRMLATGVYQVYVTVSAQSRTESFGTSPLNEKSKITITRSVVYGTEPANMSVTVWTTA